ncbi:MAG: Cna B-type domain-containing protein [Oscillospiraceae bacterium]|nr:Cna B-type domain-containing protein [Oscillospiraceae bacterium]
MGNSVSKMIKKFLKEKQFRRRQLAILLALAFLVALATTGALKLTGVTRTKELAVIDCPANIHEHTDGCYSGEGNLVCGYADFAVHTHSLDCYCEGVLTCDLPEIVPHTHTDACYLREEYLVSDQTQYAEAVDKGHTHTDACYTAETILTCELEESEEEDGHIHTDACYATEKKLTCGLVETAPVYVSADECYKVRETLICGKEEVILHTHGEDCFREALFDENGRMVAFAAQLPKDVTIPDTWTWHMVPACGQLQIEEHIHGAGCIHTIVLSPEEAEEYVSSMDAEESQAAPAESDDSESWSGAKDSGNCKDIGNEDGDKTIQEQLTWSVTINFPDDEAWTDFTYTDSFRQTVTGWIQQKNGEKTWEEGHLVHHYQTLDQLAQELDDALLFWLEQTDMEDDLNYTLLYKDQDGNEVTDGDAEVASFEILFQREAGQNLHGQSINFGYTSLVDTEDFVDHTDYTIGSDFTLPGFEGTGNFTFQYTDHVSDEYETGETTVKKTWQDVKGDPLTDNLPKQVKMTLLQYAVKGGICLTEEPENPSIWCELTLQIDQSAMDTPYDVMIKSLTGDELGTNTITVWIPKHALIQLSANYPSSEESSLDDAESEPTPDGGWSYTFDMKDVSSGVLTITVDAEYDTIYLNVIGKAPAGYAPAGMSTRYDEITLNGIDDDWSYTWEDLPLNDGNGIQYVYTIEESEVPDGFFSTVEADGDSTFTVTNRKLMERGKITVDMVWIDLEGNALVTHPDSAEVELQVKDANDEWVTVENSCLTLPNEKGEWIATWTDLPDGEYRVTEKTIKGYVPVCTYSIYDGQGNKHSNSEHLSGNAGFVTIINVEVWAEDGEIVIVKIWENEDGTPDNDHPDSIDVRIRRAKKNETSESESSEPESSEPESSAPESSEPESSEPESSAPESSEPESSEPESSEPESSEPESSTPESSTPESSEPESSEPESSKPTSGPDSSEPIDGPTTGDESNLPLLIIAEVISGLLLLAFALCSIKRRVAGRKK